MTKVLKSSSSLAKEKEKRNEDFKATKYISCPSFRQSTKRTMIENIETLVL